MIDWEKYGFKKGNCAYEREDFPFEANEHEGFLALVYEGQTISEGKIPATNQSVVLLLKAFNLPKI